MSRRNQCRGEPYYLREHLGDLHTAENWRNRKGREVLAEELGRPAKTPRRRGAKAPDPDKVKPLDELEDDQVPPPPSPPIPTSFPRSLVGEFPAYVNLDAGYRRAGRERSSPWMLAAHETISARQLGGMCSE